MGREIVSDCRLKCQRILSIGRAVCGYDDCEGGGVSSPAKAGERQNLSINNITPKNSGL